MNENTKTWAIIVLLGLIFTVMIFKAGMMVGGHKSSGYGSLKARGHQMGGGFEKMMMHRKAVIEVSDFTSEGEVPGDAVPNGF